MDAWWTSFVAIATFVTSVASIISIVLYIRYSRKQNVEIHKQTEALQKQVEELQKKPELDVRLDYTDLDPNNPFNKNLINGYEQDGTSTSSWDIRLIVCNKGKATAKKCSTKVEIIEKEPPNRVISSMFLT